MDEKPFRPGRGEVSQKTPGTILEASRSYGGLLDLPIEVLQYIALILATSSPIGPPKTTISLLSTCRYLHSVINSPQVYASIFRIQFDTAALYRRFAPELITTHGLSGELKRRWKCLGRMRAAAAAVEGVWGNHKRGVYSQAMLQEDMTIAYLMFLESDGRNAVHLLQWTRLPDYLERCKKYVLKFPLEGLVTPTYPEETALYLWLTWFCLDYRHSFEVVDNLLVPLQSYVFGTFAYPGFYAPWPYHHLPLTPVSSPDLAILEAERQVTPNHADSVSYSKNSLETRSTLTSVRQYCGQPLELALPLMSQAATMIFAALSSRFPFYSPDSPRPSIQDLVNSIPPTGCTSASNIIHGDQVVFAQRSYSPPYMQTRFATITNSKAYDDEFRRGVTCRNPLEPRLSRELGVQRYQYTKGSLTGEWDARCMIPNYETYQRIMEGQNAVTVWEDAGIFHDAHSWHIEEHYHNSRLTELLSSSTAPHSSPRPPPPGSPLGAHLPYTPSSFRSPKMKLGDPMVKGLIAATPSGDEVFYQTWDSSFKDEDETNGETVDVIISGRSIDPPPEIPDSFRSSVPLGSMIYGTIRKWDGLITLHVTSHVPDIGQTQSWLWSGYIIGNGDNANWVGRYREAHTDAGRYEGVITMAKRGVVY